ncbi:hypothetical protein KDD30_09430 [Photobacterium sp. GJ3]|uniref:hypothetical protein n=1 Tax=Photobacterium sp. GJ3 TaxID=2829502 RepID=UPI001B8B492A|nr:hypothetical protein [Photobacterium sp. GJ3]QUJ66401.1 hypothetical protein KDD30_09430 [Photobacterium sp. GJ3]
MMAFKKIILLCSIQLAACSDVPKESVTIDLGYQPNQAFTIQENVTFKMDSDYQGQRPPELAFLLEMIPDDLEVKSERVVNLSTAAAEADGSVPLELDIQKFRNSSTEEPSSIESPEAVELEGVRILAKQSATGEVHFEKTLGDAQVDVADEDVLELLPQFVMYADLDQKTFEVGETLSVKMPIDELADGQRIEDVNVLYTLNEIKDQKAYFDLKVKPGTTINIHSNTHAEIHGGGTMVYDITRHYIPEQETLFEMRSSTRVAIGALKMNVSSGISTKVTLR